MQIERLVQMVFYIVNRGHVTAKQLARHFEVSTRTIYRDINLLTLAGIPILSTKGTGGGISVIEGYTLNRSVFSQEEQQNIYQGLQLLQASQYPDAEQTLSKIGAIFQTVRLGNWLEVDFSAWGSDETQKVRISELQFAIVNKQVIMFAYINSDLQASNRTVEPLKLLFKSHAWYLVGFCRAQQAVRMFRLSRMKDIRLTQVEFQRELPPDDPVTRPCREPDQIPVMKLRFSPELGARVYDEFQGHEITPCEDGSFLVMAYHYDLTTWAFNRLLSYGSGVEVLEPEAARAILRDKALEIARRYD